LSTNEDKELQDYFESYLDLFLHKGWKEFVEDITGTEETLRDVVTCKTEKELYFRQGQLAIIANILNFENGIRNSYEDFLNDSSV